MPQARALTPGGRRVRAGATAVGLGLLLAGSVWGSDDHFPFGPFRMYAGRNPTTGTVHSTTLHAVTATGAVVRVPDAATGLRRAELEGQLPRFQAHPELLADIATAHARRRPHEPAYVEVRIVQRRYTVRDRRVRGSTDVVLGRWRRR